MNAATTAGWRVLMRRFTIALFSCAWLVAGGIGYAIWLANDIVDDRDVIEDLELAEAASGRPVNFLIIGSDTRSFVDSDVESDQFGDPADQTGQRSDTMMVVRLDPRTGDAMVVSFPRDLWVDIPGEGPAKLNAAYSRGGAKLAVETFETNFDITINHYLEVNFETFREIVDGIGEVHLFFPTSARDTVTGLSVDNPGCQALDADQALAYVRSREYEYYESDGEGGGEWKQDPTADIGRIRRQQYFIRSLMNEAIDDGARDLGKARRLLRRTVSKLRTDPNIGFRDLYQLYKAFRSTDADGVEMLTVPADLDRSDDGQSILVIRDADADPIFDRLRQLDKGETTKTSGDSDDVASTVERATVSVGVLNGSGVQGAAATALDALVDLGYQRGVAANADRDDYETTEVHYGRGQREAAQLVADELVAGGELHEDADAEYDVVVIVGRDYAGVAEPDEPIVATTGGSTTTTGPPANPGTTPGVTVPPSEVGRPLVGCG